MEGVAGRGIGERGVLRGSLCKASRGGNSSEYPMWRTAGGAPRGSRPGNDPGNHPGAEVMLSNFKCSCPVYLAYGYTDLRRGIDGLAGMVQTQFQLDPFQNALFLFCGRRKDRIKGLYWEGDGFVLLYKRLESGSFQLPRNGKEARQLTPQQYRWLMEGLNVEQPKTHKTVSGLKII